LVSFGGGMMLQEFGGVSFDAGHELVTDWWVQADRSACNYISPSPGPIWTIPTRWFRLRSNARRSWLVHHRRRTGDRSIGDGGAIFSIRDVCMTNMIISKWIHIFLPCCLCKLSTIVFAMRWWLRGFAIIAGWWCVAVEEEAIMGLSTIVLCPLFWECVKLFLRLRLDKYCQSWRTLFCSTSKFSVRITSFYF
jgi:hypothetical protein